MPTPHECLRMIAAAKACASDPESAYVLRTRLKRSLIATAQVVALRAGVSESIMPEDIARMKVEDSGSAAVLERCATLLLKTHSLCQPSEALDLRWRTGWAAVQADLSLLEEALKPLIASRQAPGAMSSEHT